MARTYPGFDTSSKIVRTDLPASVSSPRFLGAWPGQGMSSRDPPGEAAWRFFASTAFGGPADRLAISMDFILGVHDA